MTSVVQKETPVLREIAKQVALTAILSSDIQSLLETMHQTLSQEKDGVALAAPQIGVSQRIFVVAPDVERIDNGIDEHEEPGWKPSGTFPLVYINPIITKRSKDTEWLDEGCLSVRWLYGKIKRSTRATVTAYNEHGKRFTRGASGLLAQIFQHEVDHLDGILFIDTAKHVQEMPPGTASS